MQTPTGPTGPRTDCSDINDEAWMRFALELAQAASDDDEVPVGALLVYQDKVVGLGRNQPISLSDPTAHAEIQAIRDAAERIDNYRLTGTTLYTTVEPCLMCLGALLHARVGRLVFAASDPKLSATAQLERLREGGADFNHRFEVTGGVLAAESTALLHEFFRQRRTNPGLTC